jgi:hypothetical protein
MRLFYPKDAEYAENVMESKELGACGTRHALSGGGYDFTSVPPPDSLSMVKYYLQGRVNEGLCGCRYPTQKVACDMEYDAHALPYLGFWLTAGGYRGEYNFAFEPATSYYDSISCSKATQTVYMLEPGRPLLFSVTLHLHDL